MLNDITLNIPATIEFGSGKIRTLKDHLKENKNVFFLVDPPILILVQPLIDELKQGGMNIEVSTDIIPEPPIENLEELLPVVKKFNPDGIVGIGGGSTMDLAKLVSVLLDGNQRVSDIIGIANVNSRSVKLITAATTSGTGSEVTPIAVITDTEAGLKKGVVSEYLVPDVSIVDPDLTKNMPPSLTAVTGMDAMTHCIESYTNRFAHPIVDSFALEGIRLMSRNLEPAVNDGANEAARAAMALGSFYGGLCLGPVNTAAVHALAYPLGGLFKVSHGTSNSVLLPYVMNFNLPACIPRYATIGRTMGLDSTLSDKELAELTIEKISDLSAACGIPATLKELDVPRSAIQKMAEAALLVQRLLNNNPREVTLSDAVDIYTRAYEGNVG